MHRTTPVRTLARIGVLAVTAATLVAVGAPAEAAPVFTRAAIYAEGNIYTVDSGCTLEDRSSPDAEVPVVENGPAATGQRTTNATVTNDSDPTDVMASGGSVSATAKVTSVGANLGSIDLESRASASTASSHPTSACPVQSGAYVVLDYEFRVTTGGFLTIKVSNRGAVSTNVYIEQTSTSAEVKSATRFNEDAEGLKVDSTKTVYLPPGLYVSTIGTSIQVGGEATTSASGSASLHATFAVPGSQSAAPSGKAAPFLTFPSARSCTTHSLNPTITGKGKRAKKIKKVTLLVEDTVVTKVRTPHKGKVVVVPIGDEVSGELRAVVKLRPNRKGRPGKEVELAASYVACS